VNKGDLVKRLQAELEGQIAVLERAAQGAREAATHEENRPENDKDTRSVEAAYLAGAQADRVRDLARVVNALGFLTLRSFREDEPIAASALVEVDLDGKRFHYFLAPQGGGLRATLDGVVVQVLTPQSPMGQALLGKTVGEVVEVRAEGRVREYEIVAVG
jgi:hypothetical protein